MAEQQRMRRTERRALMQKMVDTIDVGETTPITSVNNAPHVISQQRTSRIAIAVPEDPLGITAFLKTHVNDLVKKRRVIKKCATCGKRGLRLRLHPSGDCDACQDQKLREYEAYLRKLESTIPPELAAVVDLHQEYAECMHDLSSRKNEFDNLERIIAERRKSVLDLDDQIIMDSYALYKPRYKFTKSDEYKVRLDKVREAQKKMLKEGRAVSKPTNWVVDGDAKKGKKMSDDIATLLLRSFNCECDDAVSSVKFGNFDTCMKKVERAAETINKLGVSVKIGITDVYIDSKIDELHIAYEYAQIKEEERQEAKALREQQREAEKAERELEVARKEAEKERTHYRQALKSIEDQISRSVDAHDRELLESRRDELNESLGFIDTKMKDIDYRMDNQRAGYVYIISNIGSFGRDIYKIGMTRRLEPMDRIDELGDASVPFEFDVHAMIFSSDAPKLEAALHRTFDDRRVNMVNNRREYFHVTLAEIKKVVKQNHDNTVEFTDEPPANQYYESEQLRKRPA